MSKQERAEGVGGDVLSLDALRPLNVTEVAEFYFCERKGALAAHHIPGNPSSPAFAIGTIEHELRHRLLRRLGEKYPQLSSPNEVERFTQAELVDLILSASHFVQDLACATHPLYVDQIQFHLNNHLETKLLDEELERATTYGRLLQEGVPLHDAVRRMLPRDIEMGLGSTRLRLKGRADQVWLRNGFTAPVDLKTHGPDLRKLFEDSHWVQTALYGILLEEAGERVDEVGLHYTYMGRAEFRRLDDELRARALSAVRDARHLLVHGGIPPVPEHEDKCNVCLHRSRCFGAQRIESLASLAPTSGVSLVHPPQEIESAEEKTFSEFHRGLARFLRRGSRSRKEIDQWVKSQRHDLLVRHGDSQEAKISVRRLLKALEKLVTGRLAAGRSSTHEDYFGGMRLEPSPRAGCVYVIKSDAVTPWVYVGYGIKERDIADRCFGAVRDTQLPCSEAVLINEHGQATIFHFGDAERSKWASHLVTARVEAREPTPTASQLSPASQDAHAHKAGDDGDGPPASPRPTYVGWISEDRSKPLKFGMRGDRVYGFVREEYRDSLAKEDFVVAEQVNGVDIPEKRVFLRVLEIVSAPLSAGTRTKSVNELGTEVLLEPLYEHRDGSDQPGPAVNDDWNGYQIRRAGAEEVRAFLGLPSVGLPLGRLVARGEPVAVNFPFEPSDALFRSFFVVGAKGKGKTSFVRALSTLATTYLASPSLRRPSVVILDGEPSPTGDSSEFGGTTFARAHQRLGEQIGATLLDRPAVQEVALRRGESGLAFSYGDIKVEDILLLLPSLTETSANVLRRILKHMAEQDEVPLRSLKDALEHLRHELHTNSQVDGRTARAIAERLSSPQVEILENSVADAVTIAELLKPGTITVLNVVDLDDDQRKVVALYLLLAFEKLAEQRGGIDTLLVLDEGEKLFPRRHGGHATPTTIQRLAGRIGGIARRGRRRRFGMMVCTQTPSDVHRDIVANCDIKLAFNVSGQDSWLRENLGADLVQGVKSLGTGECYVDLRKVVGVAKPVKTRLFRA